MQSYFPRSKEILPVPLAAAIIFGVPFTRPPTTLILAASIFFMALLLWRNFLRVDIGADVIRGRHPKTFRRSEVELASVVLVRAVRLAVTSLRGWAFQDVRGGVVFVHSGALAHSRIREHVEEASRAARGND